MLKDDEKINQVADEEMPILFNKRKFLLDIGKYTLSCLIARVGIFGSVYMMSKMGKDVLAASGLIAPLQLALMTPARAMTYYTAVSVSRLKGELAGLTGNDEVQESKEIEGELQATKMLSLCVAIVPVIVKLSFHTKKQICEEISQTCCLHNLNKLMLSKVMR